MALDYIDRASINRIFSREESILRAASKLGLKVFYESVNDVDHSSAESALSIHYPIILTSLTIDRYRKVYNLHPGFLPWGRGFYPVFWALYEGTPAGATLHEITSGIDKGPIVAQTQVPYSDCDTGGSLFARVREAEKQIIIDYWPRIVSGETLPSIPQIGSGSYHSKRAFYKLKSRSDLTAMSVDQILKLARCLTFPGYTGLELVGSTCRFEIQLRPLDIVDGEKQR